ncbi:MAG: redoxin domain-containing protein [Solirubrobacterales bacterium]
MASKTKRKKTEREALRQGRRRERLAREAEARRAHAARALRLRIAAGLGVALVVLAAVFVIGRGGGPSAGGGAGEYDFEVGSPGPGDRAPDVELTTTEGEEFDLSSLRGRRVLLYFQEGIGCQPCWDQLTDIEPRLDEFRTLGIDEIATITTDPPDLLAQKVADEGISTPVMTDQNVIYSRAYATTDYAMAGMGPTFNGHSFVLVDEKGMIEWRADYGGPTTGNTMYVPVDSLLADIEEGTKGASS